MDTLAVVSTSLLLVSPPFCCIFLCPTFSFFVLYFPLGNSVRVVAPLSKRENNEKFRNKNTPHHDENTLLQARHGRGKASDHQKYAMSQRSPTAQRSSHGCVGCLVRTLHWSRVKRSGRRRGIRSSRSLSLRSGCFRIFLVRPAVDVTIRPQSDLKQTTYLLLP